MDILDDMGVSKLSAKVFFFFKVNYSFNTIGTMLFRYIKVIVCPKYEDSMIIYPHVILNDFPLPHTMEVNGN